MMTLKKLSDTNYVATLILDKDLRIKSFNSLLPLYFNFDENDYGKTFTGFPGLRDSENASIIDDINSVLNNLTAVNKEIETREGYLLDKQISPLLTGGKVIEGVVINLEDTSQMRSLISKLKLLVKYQEIYENFGKGHLHARIITDDEGNPVDWLLLSVNRAYEKMTGLKADNVVGKRMTEVLPETKNDPANWLKIFGDTALTGKQHFVEDYAEVLDKYFSVHSFSPQRGEFMVVFTDITEKKLAQKKLEYEMQFSKKITEITPTGIYVFDVVNNRNVFINQSHTKILGYSADELYNMEPDEFFSLFYPNDIEKVREHAEKLLKGNQGVNKYRFKHKNGNWVWLRSVDAPFEYDDNGNLKSFIGVFSDITEEKSIKDKLEYEIAFTKKITDTSPNGIYIYDLKKATNTFTNPAYKNILGYTNEELKSIKPEAFFNLFHPDDQAAVAQHMEKVASGEKDTIVYRFKHRKGHWVWCRSVDAPFEYDKNGSLESFIGVFNDVTDEQEYLDKLSKSEAHLKQIQKLTKIGSWSLNLLTNEVTWSNELYEMFNLDHNNPVPDYREQEKFYTPESWKILQAGISNTVETGEPYNLEINFLRIDGSKGWLLTNGNAKKDKIGNVVSLFGSAQDITAIKEVQESLKASKEEAESNLAHLRQIQKLTKTGSWSIDLMNNKTVWTEELFNMYGLDPADGAPPWDKQKKLYTPESWEKMQKQIASVIETGEPFELEADIVGNDGSIKSLVGNADVVRNDSGQVVSLFGSARDITYEKQILDDLLKAKEEAENANKLKSNFLSNMSHEIRTPMNMVVGFTDLLREDNVDDEKKHKYLNIIESYSDQLLTLINDIVDLSKIEANELKMFDEECNISAVIIELEESFNQLRITQNKTNIQIKSVIPAKYRDFVIITDEARIRQVFTNLLHNALKFTDEGVISFGFDVIGRNIRFFVKDDGIGIQRERISDIFDRFKQVHYNVTKYGGTGLGLAICKGIVEIMGGTISVESEEGKGSEFVFVIPLNETNQKKDTMEEGSAKTEFIFEGKTILIAEDEMTSQKYFVLLMENTRAKILMAEDGKEAIKLYKENPDIDLVLMDIRMPEVNGYEAGEEILKINPDAIIIAQTANAMAHEKQKCFAMGFKDYITKPIRKPKLFEILDKWIGE